MGVYERADSPFFWMLLESTGEKRSTKVPRAATTAQQRKEQRQAADDIYRAAMTTRARARHDLPAGPPETILFDDYADWFDTHHIALRRGAARDREILKHLRAFFGRDDLTTITRARVQEYIARRLTARIGKPPTDPAKDTRRTVSPSTINREVDILKGMLREAVPKYLAASPLVKMKKLRVVPAQKRVLSPHEEARLLAVLQPADRALYIVAVDTLIRLSNVVHLKRAEFKGTHLALTDSKTGPYTVPLSTRARRALNAITGTAEYFFPRRRNVKQPRNGIRLMLRSACKRAGLPYGRVAGGITFHSGTRATAASRLIQRGVDPRTVQAIGNWKDFRAMQTYLKPDPAHVKQAVNKIAP